jgi:hypothetical protein
VKAHRGRWEATLNLPDRVIAEVHVPTTDVRRVRVLHEGRPVEPHTIPSEGEACVLEASRGTTTFVVETDSPGVASSQATTDGT